MKILPTSDSTIPMGDAQEVTGKICTGADGGGGGGSRGPPPPPPPPFDQAFLCKILMLYIF